MLRYIASWNPDKINNHLLKHTILSLLILLVSDAAFSQVSGAYTIRSEGASPQLLSLKKHSKGYFLAGTSNGLYKFDGNIFTPFVLSSSITNKSVTAIAEDKNSTVWLGFQSGEIGFVINKKVELLHAEEGHPAVAITSISADISGIIYFATAGEGIYYYKDKRFYNINTDDGLSDNYVYDLIVSNGTMVVCTDRGLNTITIRDGKKEIHPFTSADGLPDNIVRCLYNKKINGTKSVENQFWIGMQDAGIGEYFPFDAGASKEGYLKNWKYGQVNSLITAENQLWVATENNGVVIVNYADKNMTRVSGITNGYAGYGKARNLLADDEGNIWFTSNHQLIKTNGARLQNIIPISKEIYPEIHTILEDNKSNIWINVIGGLKKYYFDVDKGEWQFKNYRLPEIDTKTDITSLFEDRFGNIWVATMGKGIILIDPVSGKNRNITEDPLLINGSILSISGKGDEVWISSLAGAIHCNLSDENKNIYRPYTFLNFKNVSGIGSNFVYSTLVDSKNRVWFATDGRGITVYENGRFKNYNESSGIKSLVIYNICEDKGGNIWFSALNNGLYKYDGKKFLNISLEQGLNDVTITALALDKKNNIIAISKKGVNIINAETNGISYLDINQGLEEVNTDLNSITGKDAVYFVSNKGILRYIPTGTSLKPKIVLEGVQLFLNDIDVKHARKFSYDENNFTFSYVGISYSHPEKIRYQYKVEGFSNQWVTTKDSHINFPKFPPGTYTFHVRASVNNQFNDCEEVSYTFIIQKPFWLQWWFLSLVLIALASAVYLYTKSREKSVKRWERMEKEKIQSQFETLKSQVNPHFLFNSFNTLIAVIEDDQQMAVEYVERLSDLYRKIVTYRDKEVISLEEEIELINDYFFIQKKRFGENLVFNNNISKTDQACCMIAPLTLQLLTENAVKHNAISSETPLVIELTIDGKFIVVTNNLNPKVTSEKGAGMGLQNIRKRYKLLLNDDIVINKTPHSFTVLIPLFTNKE